MNKKKTYRLLRRIGRVLLVILALFICLVLFVRSPWGQGIIVSKVTGYISKKTNTKVEIDRLFITFSGNLFLEGLYLEDKKGDTLVYSKSLEANLPLSQILFGNEINLKSLDWDGLRATITRPEDSEKFNFSFLIDALAPPDAVSTPAETEPMVIDIGALNFRDFNLEYDDAYLGINSEIHLGAFMAEADNFDLENMRFELETMELSDTEVAYVQTKPLISEEDTTAVKLPFLSAERFKMINVRAKYNAIPDKILADLKIGDFSLELPKADLENHDFEIDELAFKNSDVSLKMDVPQQEYPDSAVVSTSSSFEWPEFLIKANKLDFENNTISYTLGKNQTKDGEFNANVINISGFTLLANSVMYRPKQANLALEKLAFKEKSGFQLKNFAFKASLKDTSASFSELKISTGNSSLTGNAALNYASIAELIETPQNALIKLNIPDVNLAVQDLFFFQPDLAENEYLKKVAERPFRGGMKANGTLSNIQIPDFNLNWGDNTSLIAQGHLKDVMQTDSLSFDFSTIKVRSNRTDVLRFVSEEDLGISLPQSISVDAMAKGTIDDIDADAVLKIPEGTAQLTGNYLNKQQIAFDGTLKVDSLRLDKLLKNQELGRLSFKVDASGSGSSLNTLNATLKSDFTQLQFKGYDFSNLFLEGEIVDGAGTIDLNFKDTNLNFEAKTKINLDSINSKIGLNLNLIGADLYALGITKEEIKVAVTMNADFVGDAENFTLDALLSDGVAVYDNEQYQMGDIEVKTQIGETSTDLSVESNFVSGILKSNASPEKLNLALQRQFEGYFSDKIKTDSLIAPVELNVDFALTPIPILTKVFLRGVDRLDSVNMKATFSSKNKNLSAKLYMPSATYNGSSVDSLDISVEGNATDLNFTAGLAGLISEPIHIKKTYFNGNLKNKELLLDFISYDEEEELVHVASEMTLAKDTINLHIDPKRLIFNKKEWSIPQDNHITIADKFLNLQNMILSRNAQELTFSNSVTGIEKEHIGIVFDNFRLQTFVSLLNPDEALASGLVKGRFVVENPFEAAGIVADFNINNLEVMQNALGNLSLDAISKGQGNYDFDLALKDGGVDLDLTGDYAASAEGARLNLDLDLNTLELKVIEGLSKGAIKNSGGYISGNVEVSGTTTDPKYEGLLKFNGANFNIATLNSDFKIDDETLKVDNSGLYLEGFEIDDANSGTFTIDGAIGTTELTNPTFDLNLDAEAFQVLNSTAADNELYYGVASIDVDLSVQGNLSLPKIDGKLRIRKITDVTYVVPESQLDVEERDGVVIFVNRENPDAILTRNDQEETPSIFKGFSLSSVLEIADDAVFHIIIDEKTGDNLEVSGDAELNLNMAPNGRINLTGRYELNSGHYETSLYNLVKRKFLIKPGGTITWQGDPTDAALDVTAIYEVETSAAPLMAAVTSGQDVSVTGKYQQVLPFLVYLNVKGQLLEPKLSFDLDMPEDNRGSLGGAVYGRVQQLNEQESALNKQVFSLLALNRFFPDSGSDGSGGGTAALARNNVNKVLSGQLNAFSDKIFGKSGFELDFDLDSFTDYQGTSPQERTQLNINAKKKLFDDRLVVTAGSAVDVEGSSQTEQGQTPIIGNVSLEYLLTEDGRYRLKGFRKNEYENVIDGQLIVTGMALIFNREFNEFSQLFNPLKADVADEGKQVEQKDSEKKNVEVEDEKKDGDNK